MNLLPADAAHAPPPAAPSATPSLRRAIGWTALGFVAMLVTSIAACSDPVGPDGMPIATTANAATG
jgi:hypothetical protein